MKRERTDLRDKGGAHAWILLLVLFLAAMAFSGASAEDAELLADLPGIWTSPGETEETEDGLRETPEAVLTFGEDGAMSLRFQNRDGESVFSCVGTWKAEFVPGDMDRLTIRFTSTDSPAHAGSEYDVECVYNIYAEAWAENSTEITALILEQAESGGVSPFEEVYGFDSAALYREKGPNMRVVNCSDYVSLRESRSKSSARLAKVPLGALVLAYPEAGDENGFIRCLYGEEYGFILAEYLEPAE